MLPNVVQKVIQIDLEISNINIVMEKAIFQEMSKKTIFTSQYYLRVSYSYSGWKSLPNLLKGWPKCFDKS